MMHALEARLRTRQLHSQRERCRFDLTKPLAVQGCGDPAVVDTGAACNVLPIVADTSGRTLGEHTTRVPNLYSTHPAQTMGTSLAPV